MVATTHPKAARAQATRRALIRAARSLFGNQGYAGTSVDDVVRAVGVTKGALYHHFRDKDDLFRAVVEEVKGDVTSAAGASFFEEPTGDDPLARVHALCSALIAAYLDPAAQRIGIVDARAVFDASTRRALDRRYEVSLLRGAFRSAMRAGAIEREALGPLSHIVAGALFEACALIAEADEKDAASAEADRIIHHLLDGLHAPSNAPSTI